MLKKFIQLKNSKKILFTPGPSSLSFENLVGLAPAFGRGDSSYLKDHKIVLNKLKNFSKHKYITSLQGSGSLAIEIMAYNFLYGNVIVLNTGYYSDRVKGICENLKKKKRIKDLYLLDWKKISNYKNNKKINWIVGCPTETSIGLHVPIKHLKKLSNKLKAKLMLDATASFPIDPNHHLADVLSYSSCKALCGLTGASFINYNIKPRYYKNSFYLNMYNHENKKMTGPYHTILSLKNVLNDYSKFKKSIVLNKKVFKKKFKKYLIYKNENQPLLCTFVSKKIKSRLKKVILYKSRSKISGSVVSHLGEVHLKNNSKGRIIDYLY